MEINRIEIKLESEAFKALRDIGLTQKERFKEIELISKRLSNMFEPITKTLNEISTTMRNRSSYYTSNINSIIQKLESPKPEFKIHEFDWSKQHDIRACLDVKKRLIGFKQPYKDNR